jgi:hypothetical protein
MGRGEWRLLVPLLLMMSMRVRTGRIAVKLEHVLHSKQTDEQPLPVPFCCRPWANSQPQGAYTGMLLNPLRQAGELLDIVNVVGGAGPAQLFLCFLSAFRRPDSP